MPAGSLKKSALLVLVLSIIFLLGWAIRWIGAFYKIRHWPNADEVLLIGTVLGVSGILFAIVKLLILKKQQ